MRATLACMVVLMSLATGVQSATAAGDYELLPCFFQNITDQRYPDWTPNAEPWLVSARCPSEVEFRLDTTGPAPGDEWRGSDFPAANTDANTIKSISFDLLGGNGSDGGLDQAVFLCSPTACSEPIRPSSSNVTTAEKKTFVAAALPLGANRVRVAGRCLPGATCTAARPLRLLNLDIIFADSVKPVVEPSDSPIDASLPELITYEPDDWPTEGAVWHSLLVTPHVRYDVFATDADSGVQLVQFDFYRLDTFPPTASGRFWENDKLCGTAGQRKIGAMCPHTLGKQIRIQPQGAINNYGIREGRNRMEITAFDPAGNRSLPYSTDFYVDSIRPKVSITVPKGGGVHWQGGPIATVKWANSEWGESSNESGLAKARWLVRDAGSGVLQDGFTGEVGEGVDEFNEIPLPGDGVWDIEVSTVDRAGNESGPTGSGTTRIGVDSTVLESPAVDEVPELGAAAVARGAAIAWEPPANAASAPSGLCGYAVALDQSAETEPPAELVLDAGATSMILGETLSEGANYLHIRAVSCAGVGGAVAHRRIDVDTSAPEVALSSPGPYGWFSQSFPLVASVVGGAETGSVAIALDGGEQNFVAGASAVAVMVDGKHQVAATARDSAGNTATLVAAASIDLHAPVVAIEPSDRQRPTRVSVTAADTASGVREVKLQFRRLGGAWETAAPAQQNPNPGATEVSAQFELPDISMAAGAYELRALAIDRAGHVGESALPNRSLTLPLREAPELSTEFTSVIESSVCVKRLPGGGCKKRKKTKRSQSRDFALVELGRRAGLSGRLIAPSGEPLAGSQVQILEATIGSDPRPVTTLETDPSGRFEYSVAPGVSRRVIARFAGDRLRLPAESSAKFLVRPRVSLRVSQKPAGKSRRVTFAGRVVAPGAPLPAGGLKLRIEFETGGDDVTALHVLARPDGTFSLTKRFYALSRAVEFKARAVLPWFAGWPYETGRSPLRRFTVR